MRLDRLTKSEGGFVYNKFVEHDLALWHKDIRQRLSVTEVAVVL